VVPWCLAGRFPDDVVVNVVQFRVYGSVGRIRGIPMAGFVLNEEGRFLTTDEWGWK
jgi:hypothetical protein